MDQQEEHSIAILESTNHNGSITIGGDYTQSDDVSIPSISFDENVRQDQISISQKGEYFLKELHDRIARLREENFDLKMKLYLYETNENLSSDCELKQRLVREFDRKNEEIRHLRQVVASKENDIGDLKQKLLEVKQVSEQEDENRKLKTKLVAIFDLYKDLYEYSKEMKDLLIKTHQSDKKQINRFNHNEQAIIQKFSKFLSDHMFQKDDVKDLIGGFDRLIISSMNIRPTGHYSIKNIELENQDQNRKTITKTLGSRKFIEKEKSQLKTIHRQLEECLETLKKLIDSFRNNQITYKKFLCELDQIFNKIDEKNQWLDKTTDQLDLQQETNDEIDQDNDGENSFNNNTKDNHENHFKQKIFSLLTNHLRHLGDLDLKVSTA